MLRDEQVGDATALVVSSPAKDPGSGARPKFGHHQIGGYRHWARAQSNKTASTGRVVTLRDATPDTICAVVFVDLPADRSAASQARRFVAQILASWQVTSEALDDCQLLVSEARHERGAARALERAGHDRPSQIHNPCCGVRCEHDRSTTLRDYGPEAVTGRGLLLVDRLSKRWGVESDERGKCVWFEIDGSGDRGSVPAAHRGS